jgi:hypothetical protein
LNILKIESPQAGFKLLTSSVNVDAATLTFELHDLIAKQNNHNLFRTETNVSDGGKTLFTADKPTPYRNNNK